MSSSSKVAPPGIRNVPPPPGSKAATAYTRFIPREDDNVFRATARQDRGHIAAQNLRRAAQRGNGLIRCDSSSERQNKTVHVVSSLAAGSSLVSPDCLYCWGVMPLYALKRRLKAEIS